MNPKRSCTRLLYNSWGRYNAMKQRLAVMNTRLHEITNLVKTKNPSLLLQLQKTSGGPPGVSSGSA
jgi:hypothetical protein